MLALFKRPFFVIHTRRQAGAGAAHDPAFGVVSRTDLSLNQKTTLFDWSFL
jgi:hypothetical protein